MKRKQSSITAQGIATIRAIESSKRPEQRICYDPLARQLVNPIIYLLVKLFAGYGERRAPGTMDFLIARTRYIDDYLQASLDGGIAQLVILGAGLDSRAYRFELLIGHVNIFEMDHPATQRAKCSKLSRIFGELPQHVSFVPIDFNAETLEKLYKFGYDPQQKTLFIWEGVTYYLTAEAVNETLEFVVRNSATGSTIIFDYVYASALTAAHKRGEITRMQRYRRFTGEGLTFGIEEGKAGEFLSQRGYNQVENMTHEDLKRTYFTGSNRNRAIAPIYTIVHATV
ncbi:MAG: SAM-dependent methyltransferase [Anaerolineae bacterium]|nr:SAM-dependent methyltransferase [Anaerolineae bacterium]